LGVSSIFAPAVAAILKGDTVSWCYGASFDFASGTQSLWQGIGPLDASSFGGPAFQGIGNFGSLSSLEIGVTSPTQSLEFQLSGVDKSLFSTALNQASEVEGRKAGVYLIFFGSAGLIGCALRRTVVMDKITIRGSMSETGPSLILSLAAEDSLAPKNGRPWSLLTQADQIGRYSNDAALERVTALSSKQTLLWITTSTA
jgi:hypothetical protein